MKNEELKIGDVVLRGLNGLVLSFDRRYGSDNQGSNTCMIAINLIKSQQSHIELLESAIREFLSWTCYKDDEPDYLDALQNLRNLMENKS